MENKFKKAERIQAYMKLAITGPAGSGKTYSGLSLASGIAKECGSRVAVVDTENGSASLYSDRFDFDVLEIDPPYTIDKYNSAIKDAMSAGYKILVIDSISHAWAGEGGLLDKKADIDARGKGNSYTNWATITKEHEVFKSQILHSDIHVIVTMRSKIEYALTDENGKSVPKKLGMAPVQRDGIEYEFTTVFDVAMDHKASVSKDRTGLWTDKIFQITEETGKTIMSWLKTGKAAEPKPAKTNTGWPQPETDTSPPTPKQPDSFFDTVPEDLKIKFRDGKWTGGEVKQIFKISGSWDMVAKCGEFMAWDKASMLKVDQEAAS